MEKIKLALDWTPNVNHIGFLVAKEKGFYDADNLDVSIISPADDNYAETPAKKVELEIADFALCPMESVVSYRTKEKPFLLKAVATVFQEDVSAIAVLEDTNIKRPKDLDNKKYASYMARYEDEIVKQMIKNDGGEGKIRITYPKKLGIWNTILEGKADATWIFSNWEGIEAKGDGIALTEFRMKDYGIPYSYSPVIAANEKSIESRAATYRKFLDASKKGFLYTSENPEESADILRKLVPKKDLKIDLKETIKYSSPFFGTAEKWGRMDSKNVAEYVSWLKKHGLEDRVEASELFTNELL